MSIADKLQRLTQTKNEIKGAIESKGVSLDGVPFSHYPYYIAPDKVQHPALVARYSARGKTNQDVDRDILKDLTGNGHDISLKNFGYTQMSGYGGYNGALTPTIKTNPSLNYKTLTSNKIEVVGIKSDIVISDRNVSNRNFFQGPYLNMTAPGKLKITIECDYKISLFIVGEGAAGSSGLLQRPYTNGVYEVEYTNVNRFLYGRFDFYAGGPDIYPATDSFKLTIEIPAEYPDGLVFDGIDDFGINDNQPILTDYTVIAKRIILDNFNYGSFLSKWYNIDGGTYQPGAFILERLQNQTEWNTYSFGARVILDKEAMPDLITIQSPDTYNGLNIKKGIDADSKWLIFGATSVRDESGRAIHNLKCVIYDVILYDRTLTEEEIESEIVKYGLVSAPPPVMKKFNNDFNNDFV